LKNSSTCQRQRSLKQRTVKILEVNVTALNKVPEIVPVMATPVLHAQAVLNELFLF